MIAVIADDFTGAAELGGIGIRHGLVTEISTTVNTATDADLLVIAADTRSMGQAAAVEEMGAIARQLQVLQPEWVFKKVDSVLRGHVVPEIDAQLAALGWPAALLVPANPSLGRTIRDGHYFFNGLPIDQSSFADDPEFPIGSSDIRDMLKGPVEIRKAADVLPATGIVVGEVVDDGDLQAWAKRVEPGLLLAGASGFFSAILAAKKAVGRYVPGVRAAGKPVFFVSGTTFVNSREAIRQVFAAGGPVSYMSDGWVETVVRLLHEQGKAMIAVGEGDSRSALQLRTDMAVGVGQVLQRVSVEELIIEGGSTAYAILRQAGLHTFFPEEELAAGVVRMRVPGASGMYITVKPGSYRWPESIKL